MPNGKPHDHPLTDLLAHGLPVYGEGADVLIRQIAQPCSHRELLEWWEREIGWEGDQELALQKSQLQLNALLRRAEESGWELTDQP